MTNGEIFAACWFSSGLVLTVALYLGSYFVGKEDIELWWIPAFFVCVAIPILPLIALGETINIILGGVNWEKVIVAAPKSKDELRE